VLRRALGLDPVGATSTTKGDAASETRRVDPERLHNFDRTPEEVLAGGRAQVDAAEAAQVESMTAETWSRLQDAKLAVLPV
jgi:hypothetical protein